MGHKKWKEEQVSSEIMDRIMEAARNQKEEKEKAAKLDSLLEAMTDIVDLPREQMEQIAREVMADQESQNTESTTVRKMEAKMVTVTDGNMPIVVTFLLGVLTVSLGVKGSGWSILSGFVMLAFGNIAFAKFTTKRLDLVKVMLKIGFRETSRKKIYLKARRKWEAKGWKVVEYVDGGLATPSFMIMEK